VARRGYPIECHQRVLGGEDVRHLLAIDRVAPFRHQMQLVAVFGEDPDRGLKVSKEPEVRGRKQDSHSRGQTTAETPGFWDVSIDF
jgi:hypothetical protein